MGLGHLHSISTNAIGWGNAILPASEISTINQLGLVVYARKVAGNECLIDSIMSSSAWSRCFVYAFTVSSNTAPSAPEPTDSDVLLLTAS